MSPEWIEQRSALKQKLDDGLITVEDYEEQTALMSVAQSISKDAATTVRQSNMSHESSIRGMGYWFIYKSSLLAFSSSIFFMTGLLSSMANYMILSIFTGGVSVMLFWIGKGLRALDSRVRAAACLFLITEIIGMIINGRPIWLIIPVYFLYLIYSEKGRQIFAEDYDEIVVQTQNIKQNISIPLLVIMGISLVSLIKLVCTFIMGLGYGY